jgi:hypothetical protein
MGGAPLRGGHAGGKGGLAGGLRLRRSDHRERYSGGWPFSLSLPASPPGTGGGKLSAGAQRPASKASRPVSTPTRSWGETEPEQSAPGAQRPAIRQRISAWHDGMNAGGPCARCRPHQRAGGGRRPSPQATEAKRSPKARGRLQPGCRTGLGAAEAVGRASPPRFRILRTAELCYILCWKAVT